MKTKIRSLIIICTLGLIGVLSANATLSYKTSRIAETLEVQNITKSESSNSTEFVFDDDTDAAIDYQMEAQLVTKWIADNEEVETIQMLIDRVIIVLNEELVSSAGEAKSANLNLTEFVFNEDADAAIDYQMEAQLVTKWIADNEEAETIQMLIDRGIIVSNEKIVSFAGEAKSANLNSAEYIFNEDPDAAIDYQMEAQLVTKWIADKEEAKVVQKLIDEGKLAENE